MRKRKSITIRATWQDDGDDGDVVMMFGSSYRPWHDQLSEFMGLWGLGRPSIEVADEHWIGFGGLKWCSWDNFQQELDGEGEGRTTDMFVFRGPNSSELKCLNSIREPRKAVRDSGQA